jgi:hypothetical protein
VISLQSAARHAFQCATQISPQQQLDLREIENAKRVQQRLIDLYSAPLMELGVRAPVERCKSSRLLMALTIATPGTNVHKSGCFRQTQTLQAHPTSVSLVDGVLTLLNVVSRLSQSPRSEPRLSALHVNFVQLNGKVRMCGVCELYAPTTASDGTRTFDLRFPAAS